jgi:hypothetical protein
VIHTTTLLQETTNNISEGCTEVHSFAVKQGEIVSHLSKLCSFHFKTGGKK